MECVFYKSNSANNVINKKLTEVGRANIFLKENNNPVDLDIKVNDYFNANYVKLGNYFYFIRYPEYIPTGNYYTLRLHIDVLESFKNEILNKKFRIIRSSNIYNRYITDGEQVLSNRYQFQTKEFDTTPFNNKLATTEACFVLSVNNTTESEV